MDFSCMNMFDVLMPNDLENTYVYLVMQLVVVHYFWVSFLLEM